VQNIDWKDDKDIYGRMLVLTANPVFNNLKNAVDNYGIDLSDALSWGQLKSKRWLINELEKINDNLGTVYICAGWYSILSTMLFQSKCHIEKIRSFDIDEECAPIADTINRNWVMNGWQFKASTLDILEMDFPTTHTTYRANGTSLELTEMPDTIINTSCEHILDFETWYSKIPVGKLIVLQSNNFYEIEDHINCVNNVDHFKSLAPMSTLIYSGELELPKYKRFMLIGRK